MVGLVLFTMGDMNVAMGAASISSFGWNTATGVAMLVISILSEALMVNFQKKLFQNRSSSPIEMSLFVSAFGAVLIFIGIFVVTDEFQQALLFMADGHAECHVYALAF